MNETFPAGRDGPESFCPREHRHARARILEYLCRAGAARLPVRVVGTRPRQGDDHLFEVEFLLPDGTVFELGPCCGDEGPGARQRRFLFGVRRFDGGFKVVTSPVTVP